MIMEKLNLLVTLELLVLFLENLTNFRQIESFTLSGQKAANFMSSNVCLFKFVFHLHSSTQIIKHYLYYR